MLIAVLDDATKQRPRKHLRGGEPGVAVVGTDIWEEAQTRNECEV